MKYFKFAKKMISSFFKIADVVELDYHILPILFRFDINLGFGEQTIDQICKQKNLDVNFVVEVLNIFLNSDYIPTETLKNIDIKNIILYLKNSHQYFISIQLNKLSEAIIDVFNKSNGIENKTFQLVQKFYKSFEQELVEHIQFEEYTVFPYIQKLQNGDVEKNLKFNINKYSENHTNIEDKLNDLKQFFLKYLTLPISQQAHYEIVSDIFDFEKDLTKHEMFEEKVLIPKVIELEKGI